MSMDVYKGRLHSYVTMYQQDGFNVIICKHLSALICKSLKMSESAEQNWLFKCEKISRHWHDEWWEDYAYFHKLIWKAKSDLISTIR